MSGDSRCPHCGHARSAHVRGKGCDVGWRYADNGNATTTGCICTTTFPPRHADAESSPEVAP